MKINLQLINTIAIVGLVLFFFFKPQEKPIYPTSTIKELQTIIADTNIYITQIKNRIEKVDITSLENRIDSLIELRKNERDTLIIIKIQDTIINVQAKEIDTLKYVSTIKDSLIVVQDFTNKSKDTIINLQKNKVKKKNRQIIKVTAIAVVMAFISIVK